MTDDGFGALMCKKVCAVTQTRLGEGVGGEVGEPRTGIIVHLSRRTMNLERRTVSIP